MTRAAKATQVRVTAKDIAAGIGGSCNRCPVVLATIRATKDTEAILYEHDWELRIEVHGRSILAPYEVRDFVRRFDGQPRTEDGRLDKAHDEYDPPGPFSFSLPNLKDPEWEERCYRCGGLFDPSELDDEGVCAECREADG